MAFIEEEVHQLKKEVAEIKAMLQQNRQQGEEVKYTVKQVADKLEITPAGVNFHIRQGHLKAAGKRCKKIAAGDLTEFIKIHFNQDQSPK